MALAVVEGQRVAFIPFGARDGEGGPPSPSPPRRTTALVAIRRLAGDPEKQRAAAGEKAETVALHASTTQRGALEEVLGGARLGLAAACAPRQAKRSATSGRSATSSSSVTTNFHQASCARRPVWPRWSAGFDDAGPASLIETIPLDGAADRVAGAGCRRSRTSMASCAHEASEQRHERVVIQALRLGDHGDAGTAAPRPRPTSGPDRRRVRLGGPRYLWCRTRRIPTEQPWRRRKTAGIPAVAPAAPPPSPGWSRNLGDAPPAHRAASRGRPRDRAACSWVSRESRRAPRGCRRQLRSSRVHAARVMHLAVGWLESTTPVRGLVPGRADGGPSGSSVASRGSGPQVEATAFFYDIAADRSKSMISRAD